MTKLPVFLSPVVFSQSVHFCFPSLRFDLLVCDLINVGLIWGKGVCLSVCFGLCLCELDPFGAPWHSSIKRSFGPLVFRHLRFLSIECCCLCVSVWVCVSVCFPTGSRPGGQDNHWFSSLSDCINLSPPFHSASSSSSSFLPSGRCLLILTFSSHLQWLPLVRWDRGEGRRWSVFLTVWSQW